MTKDWDPLAPIGVTAEQAQVILRTLRVAELHKMHQKLKTEVLLTTDSEQRERLLRKHIKPGKEIKRVKQALRREANARIRDEYF